MIKTITFTYFRRHEALTINLTEGLQTFRGANEAGKTTILEGAAYALFGSKALRDPIADVVTWTHKVSELAATVQLEAADTVYTFTRCSTGAEVLLPSGKVHISGQNEVSNFAASLLGADMKTARHLMLSDQGSLRGVLDQGPTGTSALIETLSDLDVIDRIIEAAQKKLTLGSTAVMEERLTNAQNLLALAVVGDEPAKPDLTVMTAALAAHQDSLAEAKTTMAKAEEAYTAESSKRSRREALENDRVQVLAQSEETALQLAGEKDSAEAVPINVEPIKSSIAAVEGWANKVAAWQVFQMLPAASDVFPAERFDAMHKRVTTHLSALRANISSHEQRIINLEPQLAAGHACPACGQDTSHLEHVKQAQERIVADLADSHRHLATMKAALPEAEENATEAEAISAINLVRSKAIPRLGQYVTIDDSVCPISITWIGEDVDDSCESPSIDALKKTLGEAEAHNNAIIKAQAKVEALRGVIQGCSRRNTDINVAIQALALLSDDDFATLTTQFNDSCRAVQSADGLVAMAKLELDEASGAYERELAAYTTAKEQREKQGAIVKGLEDDIETTQFNNALVKKVRAARPIIANKLWNLVLSTVSTLFSQMRGETSVVTKVGDKFLINGRGSSVSGSTLDILGLAIRCALIKTFAPGCTFLVLDEPSAACDADRSAALIGFVAAAGFKQVILVTHEDVTESLSSNLIQL